MPKVWKEFMPTNEDMLLDKIEQDKEDQELAEFDAWSRTDDGKKQIEALLSWGIKYNESHRERYTVEQSRERAKNYFLQGKETISEWAAA